MNSGSQSTTRTGFILAAIFLITPAWATAQQPAAARLDAPPLEFNDPSLSAADSFYDRLFKDQPADDPLAADPILPDPLLTDPLTSDSLRTDPLTSDSQLPAPLSLNGLLADPSRQDPSPDGSLLVADSLLPDPQPFSQLSDVSADHLVDGTSQLPARHCPHCGMPKTSRFMPAGQGGYRGCEACGWDVQGKRGFGPGLALRFGWWAVDSDGSPVKVGEFQDLKSSPFWDLDGVWSNGSRTLDLTLSGLDNEANDARAYFYGPGLSANFQYQRFLRRWDHVPLSGFDVNSGTPGPTDKVVSDDLNVGEDYAIRVQQLDASFKGQLTKNMKWRVNLWGMRKSGERQANAMAHCFNVNPPPAAANYTCHVLSQRQRIDWTTMEIEPVLEAKVGKSVVEYSRTMRAFGQNDQVVTRTYTAFDFSPAFGTEGSPFIYAWVPETFTQIDRVKLNVPLNHVNQFYANLYFGDTENKARKTHRSFDGFDMRLTNRAFQDVTLTSYAKLDTQRGEVPTEFLTTPPFGVDSGSPGTFEPSSIRHPIEYDGARVGLKGRWQTPAQNWLSFVGGYEFFDLSRNFVDYNTLSGPYTQEDTQSHLINFGPFMRVSPTLDTYVRYKGGFINNPLIGVRAADGKFNTNQPEQVHRIELGGTWNPAPNFMATSMFGIENSWHHSRFAHFDEDNYPILLTLWYAPTARLSLTGGYAFLSNWIDQDITIGFLNNPTETTQWNYDGYNNLFSCTANYAYSPRTQLIGRVEWDRGSNVFSVPPSPAGADWSALPSFSDVIVETTRINLGIDHEFGPSANGYFRYVHFDYDDLSDGFNTGTTNMFLVGLTMLR